jgi:molybdopterin molybdotransferase
MISVYEARKILSENLERGNRSFMDVSLSCGYITCSDVISPVDVPPFDNSAMDGYAVAFDGNREIWKVTDIIPAGSDKPVSLNEGEAARIFTGSPMPEGADTVIPQEMTRRDDNNIKCDIIGIKKGANVRYRGSQVNTGGIVMKAGTMISPGGIGLFASVGLQSAEIFTPPTVSVIATGNELIPPGQQLTEGSVYDSNTPMLWSSLARLGINEIHSGHVKDSEAELGKAIKNGLINSDIIILSGGISAGDYDFVKTVLERLGVKELFYKISQRPGKPLYAGKSGDKWIFALPGNPASVLTCFNQYVKPCLKFMMGHNNVWSPDLTLPLAKGYSKKRGLTFFMKAFTQNGKVFLTEGQESFNLIAFSHAVCLAELPEETDYISEGTPLNTYFL